MCRVLTGGPAHRCPPDGCGGRTGVLRRVPGVHAADLAEDFPLVDVASPALEAARLLVQRALPGLVVTEAGRPLLVLPGSQVMRFTLPDYVGESPSLADVVPEQEADHLCRALADRTVGQLLPPAARGPRRDADRPIVGPAATLVQIASVMSRQQSPIVAVVERDRVLGVITVHRLLGAALELR